MPRKPNSRPADACFVYFAECESFVKIGIARDVYSRVHTLNTASPWPVRLLASMAGGEREERMLHKAFTREGIHHRGEWFRREGLLASLLTAISAQPNPRATRGAADQWWEDHLPLGRESLGTTRWQVYANEMT